MTKYILSLFLVFHLMAVFILPNPDSIIYREWQNVFAQYGSLFGFNTTWRFFSPNPNLSRLQYKIIDAESDEFLSYYYPESVESAGSREAFNRLMNYALFMAVRRETLEKYLHPHICTKHKNALAIAYEIVNTKFPPIEKAQKEKQKREDWTEKVKVPVGEFECLSNLKKNSEGIDENE